MDGELGGGAVGIGSSEYDNVLQPFPVAAGHVGVELREGFLAGADAALVDMVGDVFGNEVEHGGGVALVEGGEIGFGDIGGGHGAEFTVAGKFCQPRYYGLRRATISSRFYSPKPDAWPNVILIISDDQGFGDYGFMGRPVVKTPRLDRIAAEDSKGVFVNGVKAGAKPEDGRWILMNAVSGKVRIDVR